MNICGSHKTLTANDIINLEQRLGHSLPACYREFLGQHNGGYPEQTLYTGLSKVCFCVVSLFYPVGDVRTNLEEENRCLPYLLPLDWMSIAKESGGKCICLNWHTDTIGLLNWESLGEREVVEPADIVTLETDIWSFLKKLEGPSSTEHEESEIESIARRGDTVALHAYVRRGGDINTANKLGDTAVQIAVLKEDITFLDECFKLGASLEGALHIAAEFNCLKSAHWLLQHGAEINGRNVQGQTPMFLAATITGVYHFLKINGGII